jgi:hypothetical protein
MSRGFRLTAPPPPKEREEQAALFRWAALAARRDPRLHLLNASQNGLRTSPQQARRAKACGMKAGVPDLDLPVACQGYHGLRIELKRKNGVPSDVSEAQQDWLQRLREQGYRAEVCYGWEAAQQVILDYLAGGSAA